MTTAHTALSWRRAVKTVLKSHVLPTVPILTATAAGTYVYSAIRRLDCAVVWSRSEMLEDSNEVLYLDV